jgi:SAM-dependent methyltransferase
MAEAAKLPDDARERLRQHFLHDRTPNRWDELWKDGTFLPWDRGVPNPALEDTLVNTTLIGSPLRQDGTRKRALVPGCGKGYDVHLLAAHGYDAFGLEVGNAVEAARKFAGEVSQREEYAAKDKTVGKGNVEFVEGDFYKGDWEKSVAGDQSGFDIIYDYTVSGMPCLCCLCIAPNISNLTRRRSSSVPCHQKSDQPGHIVWRRFLLLVVHSSVSNSQHTRNHRLVDHHGV